MRVACAMRNALYSNSYCSFYFDAPYSFRSSNYFIYHPYPFASWSVITTRSNGMYIFSRPSFA